MSGVSVCPNATRYRRLTHRYGRTIRQINHTYFQWTQNADELFLSKLPTADGRWRDAHQHLPELLSCLCSAAHQVWCPDKAGGEWNSVIYNMLPCSLKSCLHALILKAEYTNILVALLKVPKSFHSLQTCNLYKTTFKFSVWPSSSHQ